MNIDQLIQQINRLEDKIDRISKDVSEHRVEMAGFKGKVLGVATLVPFIITLLSHVFIADGAIINEKRKENIRSSETKKNK